MKSKMFEIRDNATRLLVIAIKTDPDNDEERQFFEADGFDNSGVVLVRPLDQIAFWDSFAWGSKRVMGTAHRHIMEHFDELPNFSVIDVRVLLGEEEEPAKSEIWDNN